MTEPSTTLCIESLVDTHLPHSPESAWYCTPDIPEKKLRNAIAKYACDLSAESVLALGDGTVFGSAKEGILLTADSLYCHTSEETFSVPLQDIASAKKLGGWPNYGIEIQCHDGTTHNISTTCFDKKQDAIVDFLNSVVVAIEMAPVEIIEIPLAVQHEPTTLADSYISGTSLHDINASLKLIDICQHDRFDDVGTLFSTALQTDTECPLLKGYCRYVGFNAREVDAVILLTNQRLLLFSMENGTKIAVVELTKRLLGKLPIPFLDSIVGFFFFTIPGSIFTALRGGKEGLIAKALGHDENQLLSTTPPLRKVQDFDFDDLAQSVSQIKFSNDVCTSFLDRKFGITFASSKIAKTFSIPKDLILPDYENAAPFERLLNAVRPTLAKLGLTYHFDNEDQTLTLTPATPAQQELAA